MKNEETTVGVVTVDTRGNVLNTAGSTLNKDGKCIECDTPIFDYIFKIVMLGDSGVGKSNLISVAMSSAMIQSRRLVSNSQLKQ
jgi:putative ribosome biogenesis GTPase RsgA